MDIYGPILSVSPTAPYGLIELFIAIRDSAKYHVMAVLEVHTETID
jgi:hypothetical protein